jgi:hypothetical protein
VRLCPHKVRTLTNILTHDECVKLVIDGQRAPTKTRQTNFLQLEAPLMAARKWTTEQKARQAALIRAWKPWATSTGPKTPKGKAASSKNAFNCALREVMREMVRSNRAVLAYINGMEPAPDWAAARTRMDGLMDKLEKVPTPTPRNGTQQRLSRPSDAAINALVTAPMVSTQVSTENLVTEFEVSVQVFATDGG